MSDQGEKSPSRSETPDEEPEVTVADVTETAAAPRAVGFATTFGFGSGFGFGRPAPPAPLDLHDALTKVAEGAETIGNVRTRMMWGCPNRDEIADALCAILDSPPHPAPDEDPRAARKADKAKRREARKQARNITAGSFEEAQAQREVPFDPDAPLEERIFESAMALVGQLQPGSYSRAKIDRVARSLETVMRDGAAKYVRKAAAALGRIIVDSGDGSKSVAAKIALDGAANDKESAEFRAACLTTLEVAAFAIASPVVPTAQLKKILASDDAGLVRRGVAVACHVLSNDESKSGALSDPLLQLVERQIKSGNIKAIASLAEYLGTSDFASRMFDKNAIKAARIFLDFLGEPLLSASQFESVAGAVVQLLTTNPAAAGGGRGAGGKKAPKGAEEVLEELADTLFEVLCDVEDDPAWDNEATPEHEVTATTKSDIAKVVLDKLATSVQFDFVFTKLFGLYSDNVESPEWRRRAGALSLFAYCVEGLSRQLAKNVNAVVTAVAALIHDEHRMVRHAALCALSQLMSHLNPAIHVAAGPEIGNAIHLMLDDSCPRVRREALMALVPLYDPGDEEGEAVAPKRIKRAYGPIAGVSLDKLLGMLQQRQGGDEGLVDARMRIQIIEDIGLVVNAVHERLSGPVRERAAVILATLTPQLKSEICEESDAEAKKLDELRLIAALQSVTLLYDAMHKIDPAWAPLQTESTNVIVAFLAENITRFTKTGDAASHAMSPLVKAVARGANCLCEAEIVMSDEFINELMSFVLMYAGVAQRAMQTEDYIPGDSDDDSDSSDDDDHYLDEEDGGESEGSPAAAATKKKKEEAKRKAEEEDEANGIERARVVSRDGRTQQVTVCTTLVDVSALMITIAAFMFEYFKTRLAHRAGEALSVIEMCIASPFEEVRDNVATLIDNLTEHVPTNGTVLAQLISMVLTQLQDEDSSAYHTFVAALADASGRQNPVDRIQPDAARTFCDQLYRLIQDAMVMAGDDDENGDDDEDDDNADVADNSDDADFDETWVIAQFTQTLINLIPCLATADRNVIATEICRFALRLFDGSFHAPTVKQITAALYVLSDVAEHLAAYCPEEELARLAAVVLEHIDETRPVEHVRAGAFALKCLATHIESASPRGHAPAVAFVAAACNQLVQFLGGKSSRRPAWYASTANAVAAGTRLIEKFYAWDAADLAPLFALLVEHLPIQDDADEVRYVSATFKAWVEEGHFLLRGSAKLGAEISAKVEQALKMVDEEEADE